MNHTKILIAGDIFPMPCNYDLFAAGDTQALFGEKLCALFASADVRVCNFEGCFTDSDEKIEKIGPNIKAPVSTIKALKSLGIDYVTLGNTHSMDYGKQGYLDTCQALRDNTHDALVAGDKAARAAFEEQFGKDCDNWATVFFSMFRGKNPLDMEQRKALSSVEYLTYLKNSYTRQQLLGMQMFMRNEEFNEIGNQILSDVLKETEIKEQ